LSFRYTQAQHRAGRFEVRAEIAKVCQQMANKHGEPPLDDQP